MKQLLIFVPLLLTVSAVRPKEKKTTLDDVERDYITTKARLTPPPLAPKVAAKSPTQYGFVPTKTVATYVQKEPKITYAQPEYRPEYQDTNKYTTISQYSSDSKQYLPVQQYLPSQQASSGSQQYYSGAQQYSVGAQYVTKPQYSETEQKQSVQTQAYYVPQAQGQYANYDNLQYVTDNAIDQGSQQQYYNPQQYVYLQQYPSSSNSIQAVVDPKGGLQYIMYIPTYSTQAADQTQNYENVEYANDQTYQQPESSYTTYSQPEKQPSYEIGKSSYTPKGESVIKREPKSLLDSYIPSSVQLQYYRQAQAHLNSIQDSQKYGSYSPAGAESTYRYSYRPSPFTR